VESTEQDTYDEFSETSEDEEAESPHGDVKKEESDEYTGGSDDVEEDEESDLEPGVHLHQCPLPASDSDDDVPLMSRNLNSVSDIIKNFEETVARIQQTAKKQRM